MAQVIKADKVISAQSGDLRVWWTRNVDPPEFHLVASPEEACDVIHRLTVIDFRNPAVTFNAWGLEEFDGRDWYTWYDEAGHDIDHMMENVLG
jgi:hypothetical protein